MTMPTKPRPGRQFRGPRWLLPLVGLFVLGVALYVYTFFIIVTVVNVGHVPIKSVKIEMSGKVYDLGEIEPGEWATEFAYPDAESLVTLIWMTDGVVHEELIGWSVTLLSGGTIRAKVAGGEVVGLSGSQAITPR